MGQDNVQKFLKLLDKNDDLMQKIKKLRQEYGEKILNTEETLEFVEKDLLSFAKDIDCDFTLVEYLEYSDNNQKGPKSLKFELSKELLLSDVNSKDISLKNEAFDSNGKESDENNSHGKNKMLDEKSTVIEIDEKLFKKMKVVFNRMDDLRHEIENTIKEGEKNIDSSKSEESKKILKNIENKMTENLLSIKNTINIFRENMDSLKEGSRGVDIEDIRIFMENFKKIKEKIEKMEKGVVSEAMLSVKEKDVKVNWTFRRDLRVLDSLIRKTDKAVEKVIFVFNTSLKERAIPIDVIFAKKSDEEISSSKSLSNKSVVDYKSSLETNDSGDETELNGEIQHDDGDSKFNEEKNNLYHVVDPELKIELKNAIANSVNAINTCFKRIESLGMMPQQYEKRYNEITKKAILVIDNLRHIYEQIDDEVVELERFDTLKRDFDMYDTISSDVIEDASRLIIELEDLYTVSNHNKNLSHQNYNINSDYEQSYPSSREQNNEKDVQLQGSEDVTAEDGYQSYLYNYNEKNVYDKNYDFSAYENTNDLDDSNKSSKFLPPNGEHELFSDEKLEDSSMSTGEIDELSRDFNALLKRFNLLNLPPEYAVNCNEIYKNLFFVKENIEELSKDIKKDEISN
ncbi:MAG: hypothetical protein LBI55_03905 [Oscillospiraceae bacterium]|nr:hypothetical protein [Oscillospiraceae bacterium]